MTIRPSFRVAATHGCLTALLMLPLRLLIVPAVLLLAYFRRSGS